MKCTPGDDPPDAVCIERNELGLQNALFALVVLGMVGLVVFMESDYGEGAGGSGGFGSF